METAHNSCVGDLENTSGENSPYYCQLCVPRPPPAPLSIISSVSTSASAREAKLQLDMQLLAEEKRLQEMMLAEQEKKDKELQEKALQMEKERSDKAIFDKLQLEKEYMARKYDLLRAQLEADGDGVSVKSVKSRRSSHKSVEKVRFWINNQPVMTLSAKTGEVIPTGLTSQEDGSTNQEQVPEKQHGTRNEPPISTVAPTSSAVPTSSNIIQHHPTSSNIVQANITAEISPGTIADLISPIVSSKQDSAASTAVSLPTSQSTPISWSTGAKHLRNQPTSIGTIPEDRPQSRQAVYTSSSNVLEVEPSTYVSFGSAPVSTASSLSRVEVHGNLGRSVRNLPLISHSHSTPEVQTDSIRSWCVPKTIGQTVSNQFRIRNDYFSVPSAPYPNIPVAPLHCRPSVLSVSSYQGPIFSLPVEGSSAPPFPLASNTQHTISHSILQDRTPVIPVQTKSVPRWSSASNNCGDSYSVPVDHGTSSGRQSEYLRPMASDNCNYGPVPEINSRVDPRYNSPHIPASVDSVPVDHGTSSGRQAAYLRRMGSNRSNYGPVPEINSRVDPRYSSTHIPASVDSVPVDYGTSSGGQAAYLRPMASNSFNYGSVPELNSRVDPRYSSSHIPASVGSVPVYQYPVGNQAADTPTAQQLAARHVVPKDVPSFSGNPAEWPLFWSSYETSTRTCGYSEAENLMRLQRCLKGEARKAVNCFLLHPLNVPEIIRTLSILYGRPEVIIGTLLADVRSTPAPRSEKLESVINFGLVVRNLCAHLLSTGQELLLANPMLLHELVEKLPANIKLDWALYTQKVQRVDLRTFSSYMNVIVDAASRVTPITEKYEKLKGKATVNAHTSGSYAGKSHTENKPMATKVDSAKSAVAVSERPCVVCKASGHKPKDCATFKSKSLENRWRTAQELYLCRRCLYPHGKWPCKASLCGSDGCQERHHKLLHPGNPNQERGSSASSSAVTGVVTVHQHSHHKVLFRIIPVVLHANGKSVQTFAFLDGGSDSTLVEKSLIEQLGVQGPTSPLCMQWTNGVKRTEEESQRVQFNISGAGQTKQFELRGVQTVESLGLPWQSVQFEELESSFPYLRGLPVKSYSDAVPGILIGLDNTNMKNTLKMREGKANEPVAAKTRLGWVLYGQSGVTDQGSPHRILHVCTSSHDDDLHELVKQFFSIENVGVSASNPMESADDQRAREILEATTVRTPSGRFQTGLLWKYDEIDLPNSRPMAERRLNCLEHRLLKSPELYDKLRLQIAEYLDKGYAHLATAQELDESDPKRTWYLPLGVVVNPKKPNKLRVVWDAAAVVQGVSLNSVLLKGPDLLTPLPAVLSRYRQKQIAVNADVMEMFHQMLIRPEDRQVLRFVFRNSPGDPIQVYVMDVAIFGASCSPCSAQFVKNINADVHSAEFPKAAVAIKENHYVDDYLDSVDSVGEAIQLALDVKAVHERAGFMIRHWMSNSLEVLEKIGEQNTQSVKQFVMDKGSNQERILGMVWLPQEDMFSYTTTFRSDLERLFDSSVIPTKRQVLSLVMSVFDPLGLVASFVIEGKVILQEIWRTSVGWDDKIPAELLPRWHQWLEVLRALDQVKIPRCYFPGYSKQAYESLELHVFVDASESAYAAAAYFRIIDNGEVRCSLVRAKTKVAPVKLLSIPRLELQAATIGTRLMKSIIADHTVQIKRTVLWSDSKTVLAWIRSDQRRYRQFVAFRVTEILEETAVTDWRWVPSKWNVADEATKWGKGPNFFESCRWFNGPEFLYEDESQWPKEDITTEETTTEELKTVHVHRQLVQEPVVDFKRFSKWERLVRTVAYVRRFYNNCKRKISGTAVDLGSINCEELNQAENTVWKLVQAEIFPDEFTLLRRNQQMPPNQRETVEKNSRIYRLSPFLGTEEIIRKGSRIGAALCVPYDTKFPVIVPKDHYATHLLVDWYHRKYGHANGETIVNEIRQKYHVPELRVVVRKTAKRCTWCSVYKTVPQIPRMGQLPLARLTPYVRAFTFVGIDYFGPMTVRVGRSSVKRWVALFTCMTTRAVHLEVATSLSAESCRNAIRRFIARRGAPQEIYSDQGTNFQAVASELSRQIRTINETLAATITNHRTQWKFNPPYAPHMGGVWERLVRSVKKALQCLLTDRHPDDETLATVLAEAESMVNSRLLTYLPLESEEHEALTPNHFLLLSSTGVVQPAIKPVDERRALSSNWKAIQDMLNRFWTRWIKEYLPVMSPQSKWFGEVRAVQVGDLVMIASENERNSWTRGRILRLYPGSDGRVRRVDVQTASGIHQRPVSKLAVLNVAEDSGIAGETSSDTGGGVRDGAQ